MGEKAEFSPTLRGRNLFPGNSSAIFHQKYLIASLVVFLKALMKFYVLRKRGQVNTSPLQRSEFLGAESIVCILSGTFPEAKSLDSKTR